MNDWKPSADTMLKILSTRIEAMKLHDALAYIDYIVKNLEEFSEIIK